VVMVMIMVVMVLVIVGMLMIVAVLDSVGMHIFMFVHCSVLLMGIFLHSEILYSLCMLLSKPGRGIFHGLCGINKPLPSR